MSPQPQKFFPYVTLISLKLTQNLLGDSVQVSERNYGLLKQKFVFFFSHIRRLITWCHCFSFRARRGWGFPAWPVWCCLQNDANPKIKTSKKQRVLLESWTTFREMNKTSEWELTAKENNSQFLDSSICWRCGSWWGCRREWCKRRRNHRQPPGGWRHFKPSLYNLSYSLSILIKGDLSCF